MHHSRDRRLRRTLWLAPLFILGAGAGARGDVALSPLLEARIQERLGVARFSLARIELPGGHPPESFAVEVDIGGEPKRIVFGRRSVRAPGFRLLVQGPGGRYHEAPPPIERTYGGAVPGESGLVAAGSLLPQGLHARLLSLSGGGWCLRPLQEIDGGSARSLHVVYPEEDGAFPCGSDGLAPPESMSDPASAGGAGAGVLPGGCTLREAEIAFDSDFEFFDRTGGRNPDTCLEVVETGLNITNAIYVRDVKIIHRLTALIVRSDPQADFWNRFPDASDFGEMLEAFRDEWNANMGGVRRDMAYYLTGKSNPNLGGLAYVGVVCSNFAYGMGIGNRGYEGIFRHEAGHNWGAGHDCGTEGRYIMCGNALPAISAHNIRIMTEHRDTRSCLVDVPNESPPGPPYVRLDRVITRAGEGPIAIDPAAGDTDANCLRPRLAGHDARSAFGAAILPLGPLSPGGPDALLYVPRSDLQGTDSFGYTVIDDEGDEHRGTVLVELRPGELIAYLPLDETSGADAVDATGTGHDGELRGDLTFEGASVPGRHGRALQFSGIDGEYLSLGSDQDFDLQRGLTVAVWFRVDAFGPAGDESLVAKGGDAWRLKRDASLRTLKLTLTGVQVEGDTGGNVRGRTPVDDGLWHHAAGVYDGRRAALYLDGELERELPASGLINRNSSSVRAGDVLYGGALDEIRLYSHGLDGESIRALYLDSRIDRAVPADGMSGVVPGATVLTWLEAPSTSGYDVYLGGAAAAVAAAGPGSPEYLGRSSSTSFRPALLPDAAYFWRVDPVVGGAPRKGEVRRFTTSFAHTDFDEPPLSAASFTPGPQGRELGFRTSSASTGGEDPFAGVIETGSTPTTPVFSHRSIRAETTIGPVDLEERAGASVSITLQARGTEYEEGQDWLEVRATDGSASVPLVRLDGGNALTQRAGTGYQVYAAALPEDWTQASLVVSSSSNSSEGSERVDFDQVSFFSKCPSTVVAFTHFEEPPGGASSHTPAPGGREMGFRTQSAPTSGASPFTGVEEEGTILESRLLAHRSVAATTTFDAVDLRGRRDVRVAVTVRVRDTGYEADDRLEVILRGAGGEVVLARMNGDTGLDEIAGDYTSFSAEVPGGWDSAVLSVSTESDSGTGAEGFDIRLVELTSGGGVDACGEPPIAFRRGDSTADGEVNLSDGIRILNFLFLGGVTIDCLDTADTDDGGSVDLSDAIGLFNFLFLGSAAPDPPGHLACGPDPTADALACPSPPPCP
jgi:hypothetical protein